MGHRHDKNLRLFWECHTRSGFMRATDSHRSAQIVGRICISSVILCGLGLLLAGCHQTPPPPPTPAMLVGSWRLFKVADYNPHIINIETWSITFKEDGSWSYGGTMSGKAKGTKLEGSGQWKLQGGTLEVTAEEHSTTCEVIFRNNELTLSPDPVLMVNGENYVQTLYQRP